MVGQDTGRSVLSARDCVALLAAARRGRLITTVQALPAAVPVPYVAAEGAVVVRLSPAMPVRDGDVLSLLVDQVEERTGAGWSVLVTGSARVIAPDDRLVERVSPRATEDWLDGEGPLVILADPLIRGSTMEAAAHPWRAPAQAGVRPTLDAAVALAVRAPSVHNTQPWSWRPVRDGLELYADLDRALPVLDPHGRALLVSCGASLQHARLALVAAGWGVQMIRFPDRDDPDHLARLRLVGRVPPEDRDVRLADAATRRRTDRRPFRSDPVPDDMVEALQDAARFESCRLRVVRDENQRLRLSALVDRATRLEAADAAYRTELASWTGATAPPGAGVPADVVPESVHGRTPAVRDFAIHTPGLLHTTGGDREHAILAVLSTAADDREHWLRAGEALGRVLLVATTLGLAVSPLSQPIEIPDTLARLRQEILAGEGHPQLVLRLGWPAPGTPPHLTPRLGG